MYDLLNNDEQHSKKPQHQEGPVRTHTHMHTQTPSASAAALCAPLLFLPSLHLIIDFSEASFCFYFLIVV